jgi:hypothetical protein
MYPCDVMYECSFKFVKLPNATCPVCLCHSDVFMRYPCGHPICPTCFCPRFVEYPEAPEPAGFDIPDESPEYDSELEKWKTQHPQKYAEWRAAMAQWQANEPYSGWGEHMELMEKCPLCRRPGLPEAFGAPSNE